MKRTFISTLKLSLLAVCIGASVHAEAKQPASGEQIKWQVLSGGGQRGTSTNYAVSGTLGQTAIGPGTSASYIANHGFWQTFSGGSGNCCWVNSLDGRTGNIDLDPAKGIDISDLTRLIDFLFISLDPLPCMETANTDGDPLGGVDISDITRLIDFLFISLDPTEYCL